MLTSLHIENIAVIDKVDIIFNNGFNVLTGETGAGKSIIIDAISAILGERTSRELIRTGAKSAVVSAVFSNIRDEVLSWLKSNGFPTFDKELSIFREIFLDGRNVCKVNSYPISTGMLKQLGTYLVNIHGQHDSQQLLNDEYHLSFLDSYSKVDLSGYKTLYEELCDIKHKISQININEAEKARKTEILTYQINDIKSAQLREGEDEELSSRLKFLQNAEKITDIVNESYYFMNGSDEFDGVDTLISNICHNLQQGSALSENIEQAAKKSDEIKYLCDDLVFLLRELKEGLDFSPHELDQIESRLDVIYKLKKKYGPTINDILQFLNHAQEELDNLEDSSNSLEILTLKYNDLLKITEIKAKEISSIRKKMAVELEGKITSELDQLDMNKVVLKVDFKEVSLNADGCDEVSFLASTNAGESLKPLSKIASGGELSRIMLAMKNVLSKTDVADTLIFDEIDSGISGRASNKVAIKISELAKEKQILCVTHLSQIACKADVHFKIEKSEKDGRTFTHVYDLDKEGRVCELARIISGATITEASKKAALEMLEI